MRICLIPCCPATPKADLHQLVTAPSSCQGRRDCTDTNQYCSYCTAQEQSSPSAAQNCASLRGPVGEGLANPLCGMNFSERRSSGEVRAIAGHGLACQCLLLYQLRSNRKREQKDPFIMGVGQSVVASKGIIHPCHQLLFALYLAHRQSSSLANRSTHRGLENLQAAMQRAEQAAEDLSPTTYNQQAPHKFTTEHRHAWSIRHTAMS